MRIPFLTIRIINIVCVVLLIIFTVSLILDFYLQQLTDRDLLVYNIATPPRQEALITSQYYITKYQPYINTAMLNQVYEYYITQYNILPTYKRVILPSYSYLYPDRYFIKLSIAIPIIIMFTIREFYHN